MERKEQEKRYSRWIWFFLYLYVLDICEMLWWMSINLCKIGGWVVNHKIFSLSLCILGRGCRVRGLAPGKDLL